MIKLSFIFLISCLTLWFLVFYIKEQDSKIIYSLNFRAKPLWGGKEAVLIKNIEIKINGNEITCDSCRNFFPFCSGSKISVKSENGQVILSVDDLRMVLFDKKKSTRIPDGECDYIKNLVVKCGYLKDSIIKFNSESRNVSVFKGYYQSNNGYTHYTYYIDDKNSLPLYIKGVLYSWSVKDNIIGNIEIVAK